MIVGQTENGLERGFVKHRLNCLLITIPLCRLVFNPKMSGLTSARALILVKNYFRNSNSIQVIFSLYATSPISVRKRGKECQVRSCVCVEELVSYFHRCTVCGKTKRMETKEMILTKDPRHLYHLQVFN